MDKKTFYPLTHPQKAIWYTEKFYPGTGIANIIGAMRLRDDLDFDLLEKAINIVIKNNDGLRLRLREDASGPRQYVIKHEDRVFERIDFSDKNGWEGFTEWADLQAQIPLSAIDADLFQSVIFKIADGDGGIYFKIHHTMADAWSMILIGNQISDYYFKLKAGESLPDIVYPSYTDYIKSEKAYQDSPEFQENRKFWNSKFNSVPEVTTLKPNKSVFGSCAASRKEYSLTRELTTRLNQYAEELGVSVFVLLLSSLAIYLHKVLTRDDILIGTPLLNRPTIKEKMTIGMFIETIPVRIRVDDNLDFEAFVLKVAEEWREMRRRRYPYNLLLEDIRTRNKLESNLFDIMLSYQNARFDLDLNFETYNFPSRNEANAILIHISDRDNIGRLNIEIDYQTELFEGQEINSLYKHFFNLVEDALKSPSKKLYELQIISDLEKDLLLYELNNTAAEFVRDKSIQQLFEDQVEKNPDQIAVIFENSHLTYKELNQAANRIARVLRANGTKTNSIVGLYIDRSLEMIVAILAILKAGAAYMPLDPNYPDDRIRFILEDSETRLILTRNRLISQIPGCQVIDVNNLPDLPGGEKNLENVNSPDDLAYILYTSGSTGKPKGVLIEHRSICNFFKAMTEQVKLAGKIMLSVTSASFDIFTFETLLPLVEGLTVVIANEEQQLVPSELRQLIIEQKVNIIQTTPSRMQILMMDKEYTLALGNITDIILGGEPFPLLLLDKLRSVTSARIFNGYGPTEATVYSTFKDITNDHEITIGKPVANTRVYIVDKRLNLLPVDMPGELCIGGEGIARGYLNRPKLTEEKFISSPFLPGEKIYRTGDLAKWGSDGNIHFLGRIDHQVKIRGYRIELGEVESVLLEHESIYETAVIVRQDESGSDYLCAYLAAGSKLPMVELRSFLGEKLPDYMIPTAFIYLDKMPLNANGKICRRSLAELQIDTIGSQVPYAEPRNEVDEVLVESWNQTLNTEKIGIDDNFFDLGGDSLKIVKILVSLLPYNWELTARDFYQYQTIRQLSDKVRGIAKEETWERHDPAKDIAVIPDKQAPDQIKVSGQKVRLGNVLLTGATGYLGAHLVNELLNTTDASLYCLVRGTTLSEAKRRLFKVLNFYFPQKYKAASKSRIKIIQGDITLANLGLSSSQYNELGQTIDTVIHTAAKVRHYGGYSEFQKVNVAGTRALVEFCSKYNQRLHYVSTTSISGRYLVKQNLDHMVFSENDFYVGQHYYENVYVRSKFEAENLLIKEINQGLDASIYRVGSLTGRHSDGQFQANIQDNGLYNRIRSIIELGVIPAELIEWELEFSPVDFCSRGIILLASIPESNRHVFHLFNHKTITISQFIQAAKLCGYTILINDRKTFDDQVRNIFFDPDKRDILNGIINDLSFYKAIGFQVSPEIDSKITREYFRQLDFDWPVIDQEYLNKIIGYMRFIGFIGNPDSRENTLTIKA